MGPGWFVLFVGTAALLLVSAYANGWLAVTPLEGEWRVMAGDDGFGSAVMAAVVPAHPAWWRAVGLLAIAATVASVATVVAHQMRSSTAAWLLPLLVVAHPYTLACAWRVDAAPAALGAAGGGVILLLFFRPTLGQALPVALCLAGLLALVGNIDDPSQWASTTSETCAPLAGDAGAGTPWKRRAAFAVPVVMLLAFGWRRRRPSDDILLIVGGGALVFGVAAAAVTLPDPTLDAAPGALPRVVALAWCLAICGARAFPNPTDRIVVLAAVGLMIFTGHNTARLAARELEQPRAEADRLITFIGDMAEIRGAIVVDRILGADVLGEDLRYVFPDRDVRPTDDLVDPGPDRQLRLAAWGNPPKLVLRAHRRASPAIQLEWPPDGDTRSARRPEDEPTFRWSVPIDEDPGPDAYTFVWVGTPAHEPRTFGGVDLDASVLLRELKGDRLHYSWRPSVRSRLNGHPGKLWEHEELTRRGKSMTWSILITSRTRRMVPPRRLSAL